MHEARDEWYQLIALSLYDLFFLALISNIWIVKNEEVSPASKIMIFEFFFSMNKKRIMESMISWGKA